MWTRKELKDRAKKGFFANYWKTVLAALIMAILVGGTASFNFDFNANDLKKLVANGVNVQITDNSLDEDFGDMEEEMEQFFNDIGISETEIVINGNEIVGSDGINVSVNTDTEEFVNEIMKYIAPVIGILITIAIIGAVCGICIDIFLKNPLQVGGRSFFIENHDAPAKVKNYGLAFQTNYLNIVLVMFLRDLFTMLWTMLLIVPGIIKSYEYRMIPYLMAENPDMLYQEAFEKSRNMMMGNKWNTFVLDLSFIGWHILNALTCGILGIFYVNPYVFQTGAELYISLKSDGDQTVDDETPVYENYIEME